MAEILMFLALPLLLVASAFFSGSETALFSLSLHQRLQLSRDGSLSGATLTAMLGDPRSILITLLVTNTVANVSYFVISTVLLLRLRDLHQINPVAVGALGAVPLIILILLGEVLPKLVAARLSVRWADVAAVPLMVVHQALTPLRVGFNALIITPLARLIAPPDKPPDLSAKELETILEQSRQHGVINHDEEQLLHQVLELSQLKVRDLMTPRVDIKAFDLSKASDELTPLIHKYKHSRIPIYRKDLDHIEGVVLIRQLLLCPPRSANQLKRLVRQVVFVPELQRADRLLVHFRKTGTTFAIAVDEYGGTAGLVTLEDVVEHMVGQIAGPGEPPQQPQVQQVKSGLWRVSADLSIHDWGDAFWQYPALAAMPGMAAAHSATVSTLGGLVMARLGRLPSVADRIAVGNIVIEVEQMRDRRIQWLTIRRLDQPQPPEHPSPSHRQI